MEEFVLVSLLLQLGLLVDLIDHLRRDVTFRLVLSLGYTSMLACVDVDRIVLCCTRSSLDRLFRRLICRGQYLHLILLLLI